MTRDILALNQLTGLVHDYKGTVLGGLDAGDMDIGAKPCGCDEFEEAIENDTIIAIERRHLERGIWEPADCLRD